MSKPLDDLEMFELLQIAYPEKFGKDDDATWNEALEFADELGGFDELADLLGRVVCMAMPMQSGLTGSFYHCLGRVEIADGNVSMTAAVKRECEQ